MKKHTTKDVFDRMVELAKKEPNFRYKDQRVTDEDGNEVEQFLCSYLGMDTQAPDLGRPCIVGQALADLGFTREELAEVEGKYAMDAMRELGIEPDHRYMSAVEQVQASQDSGKTWGEAIAQVVPAL
ncbi:hypothetical protein M3C66_010000 [Micrococcus luteus]|nr:hypothetical protein [Micrococcus luteus]